MLIAACPNPDCGAPAEIIPWAVAASTSGPVPHVRTLCASKHRFLLPASWLRSCDTSPAPGLRPGRAQPAAGWQEWPTGNRPQE